ncbi:hypothetical protein AO073_01480 [Pseudomonas syringae ICMP 11293]|uniref:hypothetical protein n=1 Tax=Pseudomonas syringae TaxID=317 RepID=UPI000731A3DE|nr:hypothetical protein [Pseudomonas syringae]KTB91572.1 hypothetical protein AO073_01480 [Pseudomonas syringae ICMP 11293]
MSESNSSQDNPAKWIFSCLPLFITFFFGIIFYLRDKHYGAALVYAAIIPIGIFLTIVAVRSKKKLHKYIEDTDASNLKKKEKDKIIKAYKRGSEISDEEASQ